MSSAISNNGGVDDDIARIDTCYAPPSTFRARLSIFKGAPIGASAPLLLANIIEALVALVRNIALAHLIAPKEFGLAVSLSALIGILEVLTDFGLPVYAVRKSVNLPDHVVMATVQSVAILRSALIAIILFVAVPFIARLIGASHEPSVYFLLSLIAFAGGFENLGVKAMTRDFRFGREATIVVLRQLSSLAVTVALAAYLKDFTCALWGMLAGTLVAVGLSHLLSPGRYRVGWDQMAARDLIAFGIPLLINGGAIAFCLTDRIVIAGLLGPAPLALYNVAVGTAQSPRCIVVKFLTSTFVPAFVRRQHALDRSDDLFNRWVWLVSAIALSYGFFLAFCGREVLGFIFGPAYAPSHDFMILTAMLISVSFMMHVPVPPSYASGETKVITYGSVIYAAATLPALTAFLITRSLTVFVLVLGFSELLGMIVLLKVSCRRYPFTRPGLWFAACLPYVLLALAAVISHLLPTESEASRVAIFGGLFFLAASIYANEMYKVRSPSSSLPNHSRFLVPSGSDAP